MKFSRTMAVVFLVALLLAGCAGGGKVRYFGGLDPQQTRDAVYIIPFDATLVPPDFGEPVFNEFVDSLNARRKNTRVSNFVILKEELKEVEPAWLIKQTYISGDIWGFVENSGCCSTEMRVKSRIYLYEPGRNEPTMEVLVPEEEFFEHDRTSITAAKSRMGKKLAHDLADNVIMRLTP